MPCLRLAATALTGLALLGPASSPATAGTPADTPAGAPPAAQPWTAARLYAYSTVELVGRDGRRYEVIVRAFGDDATDTTRPRFVAVWAYRCAPSCDTPVFDARLALPTAGLTIADDLSTATLRTTLGGLPLVASWTASSPVTAPDDQVWADLTVRSGVHRLANASITAFGVTCTGDQFSLTGREVIVSPAAPAAMRPGTVPSALRRTPTGRRVRCAPPQDPRLR